MSTAADTRHEDSLCIGLVGGLGVGAAVHYYRELSRFYDERGAVLHLAMVHADIKRGLAYSAAGRLTEMAAYLCSFIERLQAAGADFAVIPAATPHACYPLLAPISPLPLLSLLESTREAVIARGLRRVALFGTRAVVEGRLFGALEGVDVVMPLEHEIDYIHRTYVGLATRGEGTEEDRQGLIRLAQTLTDRERLDAILLAGTDLALIFNATNTPFPYLDCAEAHLKAIVSRAFASRSGP